MSEHPFYHQVCILFVFSLREKLQQQLKHQRKKKATNHTQNKTKKIPPQTNKNLPCQKTPSTIGNYISALLMLTKSSDLNQVCASETLVSHVSHNILKQLNHEHSMSELPLGVTELS